MKTVTLEQAVTDLRKMIKDALHRKEAITIATEDDNDEDPDYSAPSAAQPCSSGASAIKELSSALQ